MDIELKVKKIFGELFEFEDSEVSLEMTMNDVEEWDSLMHIQLVIALEKEFHIKFSTQQIISMKSVKDTVCFVQENLKQS